MSASAARDARAAEKPPQWCSERTPAVIYEGRQSNYDSRHLKQAAFFLSNE